MSNVSNDTENTDKQDQNAGGDEGADKFVARSAYEEVSRDMHKYKSSNKDLTARLNELETKIKTTEETQMQKEKRFEELYQKEREQREKTETALKNTNDHYVRSVKMTALIRELGGNVKPKYLSHAALDEIIVHEDGSLSSESLTKVANKFRQENPELVPTQAAGNINDAAPANNTFTAQEKKTLDNMSQDEKRALLASKRTTSSKVGLRA